jgi:hypothetical protein
METNNSIISEIQNIDVSNIEGVRFFQNDGKSYSISLDSIKRITLYISKKYNRMLFSPWELSIERDYFTENFHSELSSEDRETIVGALSEWVEKGGRFEMISLPDTWFIHRIQILLYWENGDQRRRFTELFLGILLLWVLLTVFWKIFPRPIGNYISMIFFLLMNIALALLLAVKCIQRKDILWLLLVFLAASLYFAIKIQANFYAISSLFRVVSPFILSRVFVEAILWIIFLVSIFIVWRRINPSLNVDATTNIHQENTQSQRLLKIAFSLAWCIPVINLLFTLWFKIYTSIGWRYNNMLRKIFEWIQDFTNSLGWFLPVIAGAIFLISKRATIKEFLESKK